MMRVVVVELDVALRGSLRDVLVDAGHYDVVEVTTTADALEYLATCPERAVVVCSNVHPNHHQTAAFIADVMADQRLMEQHQYLLLSSNPASISPDLRAHLAQLDAPILPKPFDMDVLLAAVCAAATRLASIPTPAPYPIRDAS